MLDDEKQRLITLFSRCGDKTGFARLLSTQERRELFLSIVVEEYKSKHPEITVLDSVVLNDDIFPLNPKEAAAAWAKRNFLGYEVIPDENGTIFFHWPTQEASFDKFVKPFNFIVLRGWTVYFAEVKLISPEVLQARQKAAALQKELDELRSKYGAL